MDKLIYLYLWRIKNNLKNIFLSLHFNYIIMQYQSYETP